MQTAQGMFPGTALCREKTGKVSLEWAKDGKCEAPGLADLGACLDPESAATQHCGVCLDIPIPSETSLRSAVVSQDYQIADVLSPVIHVLPELSEDLPRLAFVSEGPVVEQLGSIRLLI